MQMVKVAELKSYWGKSNLEDDIEHTSTEPILISSDGYVIDGHKRIRRAKQDGIKEIPAIHLDVTFEESKPLRHLDCALKKKKLWDLSKLYKKAIMICLKTKQ